MTWKNQEKALSIGDTLHQLVRFITVTAIILIMITITIITLPTIIVAVTVRISTMLTQSLLGIDIIHHHDTIIVAVEADLRVDIDIIEAVVVAEADTIITEVIAIIETTRGHHL